MMSLVYILLSWVVRGTVEAPCRLGQVQVQVQVHLAPCMVQVQSSGSRVQVQVQHLGECVGEEVALPACPLADWLKS